MADYFEAVISACTDSIDLAPMITGYIAAKVLTSSPLMSFWRLTLRS